MDNEDAAPFFSHLHDIAAHLETTRGRESVMQEACRLSSPILTAAEFKLAWLAQLYCQLYRRNQAGAPDIYAENGPLDELERNCRGLYCLHSPGNTHLTSCRLVDDLKSERAALAKRAENLRAASPPVFQSSASRTEVALVLGAGPIGLLRALAA